MKGVSTTEAQGNGHSASWELGYSAGVRAYARSETKQANYGQLRAWAEAAWEAASRSVVTNNEEFCSGYFTGWEQARKGTVNNAE